MNNGVRMLYEKRFISVLTELARRLSFGPCQILITANSPLSGIEQKKMKATDSFFWMGLFLKNVFKTVDA